MTDQGDEVPRLTAISLHNVAYHTDLVPREREGAAKCLIQWAHKEDVPLILYPPRLVAPKTVGASSGWERVAIEVPIAGVCSNIQVPREEPCRHRPARGSRELIDEGARGR